MSSLTRRIQRKHLRAGTFTTDDDGNQVHVKHEPQPQVVIYGEAAYPSPNRSMRRAFSRDLKGGYVTVRYTRGPLRVSARRLAAQGKHAELVNPAAMRSEAKAIERSFLAVQAANANDKRIDELLAMPVAAISRQVRRHAQRTGRALPTLIGAEPKKARKPRAKKADNAQAAAA